METSNSLLQNAIDRCKRAADLAPGRAVLVGFSGGKDSLATLDVILRSQAFTTVECFAMYLVPGLDAFEGPIRKAQARFGVKIHMVPHWDLARFLKFGVLRMHVLKANELRLTRLKDVERALTLRTGIEWFSYGERGSDSVVRRIYTSECDGVQREWKRLWPIWDWTKGHVYGYLHHRRIPTPKRFTNKTMDGITLMPDSLKTLKEHFPDDYARILQVFPFADLQLEHARRFPAKGDADEVPEVPDGARPPKRSKKRSLQSADHQRRGEEETPPEPEPGGLT